MFQSTIIIDPRGELKGKQTLNSHVVSPSSERGKAELIRVEDIQKLHYWSQQASFSGDARVVVIEQFQMSSPAVSQTLLKLLEEPPADLRLVITVDQIESVIPTIISRCVVLDIRKMTSKQLDEMGLGRQNIRKKGNRTSWNEFATLPYVDKLKWSSSFVKGKKDVPSLLEYWRSEIVGGIEQSRGAEHLLAIHHLSIIEEAIGAGEQKVLPRLIFHHLITGVERRSI